MTKKDYQSLASILGKHQASVPLLTSIVAWLQDENPAFDEWRFRTWVAVAQRNAEIEARIEKRSHEAARPRSRKRDLTK